MRADVAGRMTEAVTVVHRAEGLDLWTSRTVEGSWQVRRVASVGADGTTQWVDRLTVQVPQDQGDVAVALGDWLVRGALSASGLTTSELRPLLPEGSRRVGTIRDLRGGLSGISGPVTRYASSLVLEAV